MCEIAVYENIRFLPTVSPLKLFVLFNSEKTKKQWFADIWIQ